MILPATSTTTIQLQGPTTIVMSLACLNTTITLELDLPAALE
jgi:hypothetical protein